MTPPPDAPAATDTTLDAMTQLLHAWQGGSSEAFGRIVQALHAEFLRMAASRLRGHDDASLSRGDVVNEAMLRLMNSPADWQNRAHFFATVSLTMRSVLREHARARLAGKRDGGDRVELTLASAELGEEAQAADLLTLDKLLERLGQHDPRAMQILDMTYFAGLQRHDIATVLGVSVPTVDRELRFARAWLVERLGRELEA
ncbi:ECF-type sigma factor [Paucibacter sp. APW11]|uniref:ECF-type sigma factor n=1 Tax=Roseateles aquae TaxID=3077235 RepID=A0ABU3P7Y7_9BURK|nr:ECF-type sigma factor [Paucibacter sp. APW11]MDT8998422.1 ECF-type sigma factor [Paucibacter sp. APW11]